MDATIIDAPSSTKNRTGQRDPEMRQVKKGNQYHFGMKLHIGVDAKTGVVHSRSTTSANVHDVTEAHRLLHGEEQQVWGDAGYIGVQKREENLGLAVDWQVAMKPGQRRKLDPESDTVLGEKVKASIRAKVEHPFLDVKRLFGYAKSLPSSPIGGTLPGPGQEHGPVGAAAGVGQPETRPGPSGRLIQGAVRPIVPHHSKSESGKPRETTNEEKMKKKRRAVSLSTSPHKSKIFISLNCSEVP